MNDPGDEDDGAVKRTKRDEMLLRYRPYEVLAPLTILYAEYGYNFPGRTLRVKHPDHDLGDEDRRNNYFPIARPIVNWPPMRANPPRPCR